MKLKFIKPKIKIKIKTNVTLNKNTAPHIGIHVPGPLQSSCKMKNIIMVNIFKI